MRHGSVSCAWRAELRKRTLSRKDERRKADDGDEDGTHGGSRWQHGKERAGIGTGKKEVGSSRDRERT